MSDDKYLVSVEGTKLMTMDEAIREVPQAFERVSGVWVTDSEGWAIDVQFIGVKMSFEKMEYQFAVRRI